MYDYIIVGAGLYGLLISYKLNLQNKKILLIDKKDTRKKNKFDYMIISKKSYMFLEKILCIEMNDFIYKKCNQILFNQKILNKSYYILDLKKLRRYLYNNLNNVELKFNTTIDKYLYKKNILIINYKEYKYKNLIATDGVLSETRMNITHKLQSFSVLVSMKSKKSINNLEICYKKKRKLCEQIISVRKNSYVRIINSKKRNNIFNNINEIKKEYIVEKSNVNVNLIPNGNIFLNKDNIYFLGDSSGIIDPFNYLTLEYNLDIINMFPQISIKYIKKIKRKIFIQKILSKLMYLPIIDNLVIKIFSKNRKEDL